MRLSVLVTAFALLVPLAAHADNFTLTGQGQTIAFSLPDSPQPSEFGDGTGFAIDNVDVDFNGTLISESVGFYAARTGIAISIADETFFAGGGASASDPELIALGSQLYTGSESSPTFVLGTYTIDNGGHIGLPEGDYSLTITGDTAVTPEPSSLALLGSGVIGLAGLVRRRFIA